MILYIIVSDIVDELHQCEVDMENAVYIQNYTLYATLQQRVLNLKKVVEIEETETKNIPLHEQCDNCKGFDIIIDIAYNAYVCRGCGSTIHIFNDTLCTAPCTYKERRNYNRSPRHFYSPIEHFCRYLGDVTATNQRIITDQLMYHVKHCIPHRPATENDVFNALKSYGNPGLYILRWELMSRLNNGLGFSYTSTDAARFIHEFKTLYPTILSYQKDYYIRQRSRVVFPYRFIIAKIAMRINRCDMLPYIPKVKSAAILQRYESYWEGIIQRYNNGITKH